MVISKNTKKEVRYVVDNCSYFNRALVVRVSFVVHNGRVYSRLARYCRYRYYFASYQRPETTLIAVYLNRDIVVKLKGEGICGN